MKRIFFIIIFYTFSSVLFAQNVGIGINSPKGKLHIKGNADTAQLLIDANITQGNIPIIRLRSAYGNDMLHLRVDTSFNLFFGYNAGANNDASIGGHFNTFIGSNSGFFNTNGKYNTALGRASLYQNTAGEYNTALGFHSLFSNISGSLNTAVGSGSLDFNQYGGYNTALGYDAIKHNINGFFNTAVGTNALLTNQADYNTAVGTFSMEDNSTGLYNTSVGYGALMNNDTASNNTAIGSLSLANNELGNKNTALGSQALAQNINCNGNTAVGYQSLYSQSGSAAFIAATENTAVGAFSLKNNNPAPGGGSANTAVGHSALQSNTTGSINTGMGYYSLEYVTTGIVNTALGVNSGVASATGGVNNTISIGNHNALNAFSNQAFLGNFNIVWNGGNLGWSTFSDARIKTNITEDVKGLAFITRLRPVTYFRNTKTALQITGNKDDIDYPEKYDIEKIKFSGFLAQEVEQAAKESGYDFSGVRSSKNEHDLYSLTYSDFVVPLVKAVQEQQKIIETLQKQVEASKTEIPVQVTKQQLIIEDQNKKIEFLLKELQLLKEKIK